MLVMFGWEGHPFICKIDWWPLLISCSSFSPSFYEYLPLCFPPSKGLSFPPFLFLSPSFPSIPPPPFLPFPLRPFLPPSFSPSLLFSSWALKLIVMASCHAYP